MSKAPVVMISFNRPDLVRLTMQNISLSYGVEDRDIFMFIDGPRNESDASAQEEIFEIVSAYKTKLPRIDIIRRERNYGCRGNIVDAITYVINQYGRTIIVEDDILVSRTFLKYMDAALDFYEADKGIWCINAYQSPFLKIPRDYPMDVYLNPVNMCWGWGTWANRWNCVDFEMSDWSERKSDEALIAKLNKAGRQIIPMIEAQVAGRLRTWDVQCTYHVVKNDLLCVEPRFQLTKNIGFLPGGEHITADNPLYSRRKYYDFMPRLERNIMLDNRIAKQWENLCSNWSLAKRCVRKIETLAAYLRPRYMEPIVLESKRV